MTPNPEDTRFHIYVVRESEPCQLASTSKEGIGTALVQLRADGEFDNGERVGILDRLQPGDVGIWIINPWASGK